MISTPLRIENPEDTNDDPVQDMNTTCQESHSASYYRHLSLHSVLHITMDLLEGRSVEVDPNQLERIGVFDTGWGPQYSYIK